MRAALKRLSAVAAFLRSIGLAEAAAHAEDAALDGETLVHTLAKPDAAVIVRLRRKRVGTSLRVSAALPPRCRRVASIRLPRSAAANALQPSVRGGCRHVVLPNLRRSAI